jgi:hypothetical protein
VPAIGNQGNTLVVDIALYRRAWDVYRARPSANAIYEAIPEIGRKLADKLVHEGIPQLGLVALSLKFQAAINLAIQQDVDEAAAAVAVGRKGIRTLLKIALLRGESVLADPKQIAEIKPSTLFQSLPALVKLNEDVSKPPKDLSEEALEKVAELTQSLMGGVLKAIGDRRLPKPPDPSKVGSTTLEELEKMIERGEVE